MDPKLSTAERKMQEELLRHEFPFDEKAWASMEALLEEDKKKPVAGLPPAPNQGIPGPGRNRSLLLILLFSAGLGAASLAWWNGKQSSNSISSSIPSGQNTDLPLQTVRKEQANGVKTNALSPEISTESPGNSILNEAPASKRLIPSQKKRLSSNPVQNETLPEKPKPENAVFQDSKPISTNQKVSSKTKSDLKNDSTQGEGLLSHSEVTQAINEIALLENEKAPNTNPTETMAMRQFWDLSNLFIWPPSAIATPEPRLGLDSLVRPVKRESPVIKRFERGWILGANANTVDYQPLRLSVLPHLGYFVNYRFRPNTVLQAELITKYVHGYQLHAEFMDIIPGGSSHIILNTNDILFFELPVVLKQQFRPEQSWLLGIKPSGNLKVLSYGLASYSNNAPGRLPDSQNGIRYFDLGLVLGWEWRYSKYWALDIRYNQGLLDLTYDQFYRDNSTHLNSDLQVSLRYSIHHKSRRHVPKTLFPTPAGK